MHNFILLGICLYIFWRLYRAIKSPEQNIKDRLEMISDSDGKIIRIKVLPKDVKRSEGSLEDDLFLSEAKNVFKTISYAFAEGKLDKIKKLVDVQVFDSFQQAILKRQENKEKVEFELFAILSAQILPERTKEKMSVEFISEQYHILRNEKDEVIEGNPEEVTHIKDKWIFKKEQDMWLLYETESQVLDS